MNSLKTILLGTAMAAVGLCQAQAQTPLKHPYSHVLLLSVDGMHAVDLTNYIADPAHSGGALAQLSNHAVIYPNAFTTAPSDSFPGMTAQVTGGTPKSTGIFYDDHYDRDLFPAGSNCKGLPGTEVNAAEAFDYNQNLLNAGGTLGKVFTQIDPKKLPLRLKGTQCLPAYPHNFMRVNDIFEVVREHGGYTAWSDKHPAYEMLEGPSGRGINDIFTPEINSLFPGGGTADNTGSYRAVRHYDDVKVQAVINWIDGLNSTATAAAPVPNIFGMNYQSLSVAQKLAKSGPTDPAGLVGGYLDENATPGNAVADALAFVDSTVGQMVDELKAQGLYDSTMIIISAKHGQSPIDRTERTQMDDSPYTQLPGYGFHIADDVVLIWLKPELRAANLAAAKTWLETNGPGLGIVTLLDRTSLMDIYEDPQAPHSRTPDFIGVTRHGLIYTGGSKLSEHGGFSNDDRNVTLMVSAPSLSAITIEQPVQTTQIAPTILYSLGYDPKLLQAVKIEGTQILPNLFQ